MADTALLARTRPERFFFKKSGKRDQTKSQKVKPKSSNGKRRMEVVETERQRGKEQGKEE